MNRTKPWWQSKTVLLNLGIILTFAFQAAFQQWPVPSEVEAAIVTLVNILLRSITNTGITLK